MYCSLHELRLWGVTTVECVYTAAVSNPNSVVVACNAVSAAMHVPLLKLIVVISTFFNSVSAAERYAVQLVDAIVLLYDIQCKLSTGAVYFVASVSD